jgi:hypothetical protein
MTRPKIQIDLPCVVPDEDGLGMPSAELSEARDPHRERDRTAVARAEFSAHRRVVAARAWRIPRIDGWLIVSASSQLNQATSWLSPGSGFGSPSPSSR